MYSVRLSIYIYSKKRPYWDDVWQKYTRYMYFMDSMHGQWKWFVCDNLVVWVKWLFPRAIHVYWTNITQRCSVKMFPIIHVSAKFPAVCNFYVCSTCSFFHCNFDRVQFTNTVFTMFTKVQFHSLYLIPPFILRPDINSKITSDFSPKGTIRMIRSLPPPFIMLEWPTGCVRAMHSSAD